MKSDGNAIVGAPESVSDNQEYVPTKSKKNKRKGKDTSSLQVSDSKTGAKKESVRTKEDNLSIPSEEWIMQKIMTLVPDFEEQGMLVLTLVLLILIIKIIWHPFHTYFPTCRCR